MIAESNFTSWEELGYSLGKPAASACYKQSPEHFIVTEVAEFDFSDQGEHLWLYIEKTGMTTQQMIEVLQRYFSLPEAAIGISGRKDKQAVTTQWVSLHLKRKIPVRAEEFTRLGLKVLDMHWHISKLRHGSHTGNSFVIKLSNIKADQQALDERMEAIAFNGVPNYFGPQRFGPQNRNIQQAVAWLTGQSRPRRYQQGLLLSSLRSALFNELLSRRVVDSGLSLLAGDCCLQTGKETFQVVEYPDAARLELFNSGKLKPAMMFMFSEFTLGEGWQASAEQQLQDDFQSIFSLLKPFALQSPPRTMRILPQDFRWRWGNDTVLELSFTLPSGCYATSVLRELVRFEPFGA